jgi:hypothetical protein
MQIVLTLCQLQMCCAVMCYGALHAEVFLGQPYNEKADVFSFGVGLYGELHPSCTECLYDRPAPATARISSARGLCTHHVATQQHLPACAAHIIWYAVL